MLKCSNVGAIASVRPSKANFVEQYKALNGVPTIPRWLLLLMMWPLCLAFMLGITDWINLKAPKKLTSYISFAMSMGVHSRAAHKPIPALLTVE